MSRVTCWRYLPHVDAKIRADTKEMHSIQCRGSDSVTTLDPQQVPFDRLTRGKRQVSQNALKEAHNESQSEVNSRKSRHALTSSSNAEAAQFADTFLCGRRGITYRS